MPEIIQAENKTAGEKPSGLPHWLSRLRSYFIFDPLVWFYTIILGCLSLLCSLFDRSGKIQHSYARLWSRMILGTIGAPVSVEGLEKLNVTQARVYVVNHLSALDIPVLYQSLPFQFRILAKRNLFHYPFMGWHLRRSGQIPVDLDNARTSVRSLNQAVQTLRSNMSLVIFPEGARSADGHLQPFMAGAFYAAIKAQVEVVPMTLIGTHEMLPMNTWHIKPRPVRLVLSEPISTKGMSAREMDALTKKARDTIAQIYYSSPDAVNARGERLVRQESN
jgi:1-acyl-sn-glycerol-3-phosphate acyltransferase